MNISRFPSLMKEAYTEWSDDNCLRLGASLAYYTLSSLVPLLLVVVSIATFILNFTGMGAELREQIVEWIAANINNEQFAQELTNALTARENAAAKGTIGTILGVSFLLLAALSVFGELDAVFFIIWDLPSSAG